jgi:hypothetical protein
MTSQQACEDCTRERLFFADGIKDGEEEVVEERLGPHVFLPPPVEDERDVEAQVSGCEDERTGGSRCRFIRFCGRIKDGIQDMLSSRETRITLVVGTIIFAMFGLMVCRVISLERMCPHETSETAGTSGADVCEQVYMHFMA